MIDSGNATIFVSDFERAVEFYTGVMEFPLRFRAGNFWAEVAVGEQMVIGIHPQSDNAAPPGTAGSIHIGLNVTKPIEEVVQTLTDRGVRFDGPIVADDDAGKFANFRDPDGNRFYLWEAARHE
ncbi:MAG: VOC family protein [Planctomycetota bacterium]|jgi:predicted enzyme related to lactoylglutathione lyase